MELLGQVRRRTPEQDEGALFPAIASVTMLAAREWRRRPWSSRVRDDRAFWRQCHRRAADSGEARRHGLFKSARRRACPRLGALLFDRQDRGRHSSRRNIRYRPCRSEILDGVQDR